jgi:hypothetical protein
VFSLSLPRLVTEGIPSGFYSHIFVDEAGQPAEPEGVIPLAGGKPARVHQIHDTVCQILLSDIPPIIMIHYMFFLL